MKIKSICDSIEPSIPYLKKFKDGYWLVMEDYHVTMSLDGVNCLYQFWFFFEGDELVRSYHSLPRKLRKLIQSKFDEVWERVCGIHGLQGSKSVGDPYES